LEVLQIRNSIPSEWRRVLYESNKQSVEEKKVFFIDNMMYKIDSITTKLIYLELIRQKGRSPSCIVKWSEDYPGFHNAHEDLWPNIFYNAFNTTQDTKLQTFQFKIIHRLIVCNKKLSDMKIKDDPKCDHCDEIDDLLHFFLFCPKANQFWNSFFNWWNNLGEIQISIDYDSLEESVIFGFLTEGGIFTVLNFCILLAKYHIYNQRIHNGNAIDFFQYLIELKNRLKLEYTICTHKMTNDFEKYSFLFDQL